MSIKPLNLKQMECIHDIKNGSVCVWTRIYILTCVQVCLEGQISRKSAIKSISDGRQPAGDQIPWKICEEFQDTVFPSLSGARIVRIATHPAVMRVIIVKILTKDSNMFFTLSLCTLFPIAAWIRFCCSRTIDKVCLFLPKICLSSNLDSEYCFSIFQDHIFLWVICKEPWCSWDLLIPNS